MTTWEDLRKQARKYENEIDHKLVALSKLGIGLAYLKGGGGDNEPLLSGEHAFETAVRELEQLLSMLSTINDKLGEMGMTESGNGSGAGMVHTLQRHREIFQDYTQEFKKTQQNFRARREREDLLHSVRNDIDAYKTTSGLNRRSDLYSKEYEHLRSSDKLVDDQISIAVETRDHLVSQRLNLKRLQMRMHDISSRFPLINGILQRVNLRRRRDSLILALVISFCTILTILYVLR